jgi:hypothetical protein
MKVIFTLSSITGTQLHAIFSNAITEEGVGFKRNEDGEVTDRAILSAEGKVWNTYTSKFTYTILNPEEDKPAEVEYSGACKGFLRQELLPEELLSKTSHARIIEGSVLEKYGLNMMHSNASTLVKAYGLMQKSSREGGRPFERACAAVEAALAIDKVIESFGMKKGTGSGCYARPFEEQFPTCAGLSKDEPSVTIVCCLGGEHVKVNILLPERTDPEKGKTYAIRRGTKWIEKIQAVIEIKK